ncbi:MAG: hypothetical protein PHY59_04315 [Methanobacterium sp.]|nr:hypothetical protein [Methanobacterium sp.]
MGKSVKSVKKVFFSGLAVILVFTLFLSVFASTSTAANLNNPVKTTQKDVKITKKVASLIAQLNDCLNGVTCTKVKSAYLTSDKKFWKVKVKEDDGTKIWTVTVNAATGASKKKHSAWRSFNELKALYVAELYTGDTGMEVHGKPKLITVKGQKLWKIKCYDKALPHKITRTVYFDDKTGKSKDNYTNKWFTLKQLDDAISQMYGIKFRDALRDFYPD